MSFSGRFYSFFIAGTLLVSISLAAQEITLWGGVVPDGRYEIVVVDDFEDRVPWSAPSDLPSGSFIRMVKNSPSDGPPDRYPANVYLKDVEMTNRSARFYSREETSSSNHCQEIQIMVESPGRDALVIRPPDFRSVPIPGKPMAFSLWVFGYGKRHVLYALVGGPEDQEYMLRLGDLNFRGWRRLEVGFKPWMVKKKPFDPYQVTINGLKLITHPKEDSGLYLLRVDLLQVLVDHGEEYPGSQIDDQNL